MYVLKFNYDSVTSPDTQTKMLAFVHLAEAKKIFDGLVRGYQFNEPVQVRGGKVIDVIGVWLYQADTENHRSAVDAVKMGAAVLLDEARKIEIDIDLKSNCPVLPLPLRLDFSPFVLHRTPHIGNRLPIRAVAGA